MLDFLKRISLSLILGVIFVYFSELMFWATPINPEAPLTYEFVITWLFYSLAAYIFLFIISFFKVRSIWALFISGALYGWMIEGVIVQTTYEDLPFSISFTGLAWHALITVLCGWYLVSKTLQEKKPWKAIGVSIGLGLFYGFWSITWWVMEGATVFTTIPIFSLYVGVSSIILIAGYILYDLIPLPTFKPTIAELIVVGLFIIGWYILDVIMLPLSLILIPLVAISVLTLWWNRRKESDKDLNEYLNEKVPILRYSILLIIPVLAIGFYALSVAINLRVHTNWVVYLITTPLGFIMFILSIIMVFVSKEKEKLKPSNQPISESTNHRNEPIKEAKGQSKSQEISEQSQELLR